MKANPLAEFHVLIVDDERLIQKLVMEVLNNLGFRNVIIANSGRQAIELLSRIKFDFIISDWRMGDLDGIDIVRFVRTNVGSLSKTIPVIMLTGNTEAYYVKTAIAAGVNSYLIKPFSAEQLVKRIRMLIENPRDFIVAPNYIGPDRRWRQDKPPNGDERRKSRKKKDKE